MRTAAASLIGYRRALLAGAGLVLLIALLTPLPALHLSDGLTDIVMPLGADGSYSYSYINSIYGAPVVERHARFDDRLMIDSVFSSDIRAVEYFRWDGQPERVEGGYVQTAPTNSQPQLTIRVTPQYRQQISGSGWTLDLATRFGDGVVRVSPTKMPRISVLLKGWSP